MSAYKKAENQELYKMYQLTGNSILTSKEHQTGKK